LIAAEFVVSAASSRDFPRDGLAEIAFAGRSNVGKSTLINALVGQRLARTSAAPGKTRLINFYRVRTGALAFYVVDLPGYGYARGGAAAQRAFQTLTREYFGTADFADRAADFADRNANLTDQNADPGNRGVVRIRPTQALLLVDARHPGLPSDRSAWQWFQDLSVPITVVVTKIDKLTRAERPRAYAEMQAAWQSPLVPVSAATGEGMKELWTLILEKVRPA
jgi:GTP-binding protein